MVNYLDNRTLLKEINEVEEMIKTISFSNQEKVGYKIKLIEMKFEYKKIIRIEYANLRKEEIMKEMKQAFYDLVVNK